VSLEGSWKRSTRESEWWREAFEREPDAAIGAVVGVSLMVAKKRKVMADQLENGIKSRLVTEQERGGQDAPSAP
jgi:hypothetical protein